MSERLAEHALALVKEGRPSDALVAIEVAGNAFQHDETVARTYALALAQTKRIDEAVAALRPFLVNASTQTRALAARLFEDSERANEAFAQYAYVVNALPNQMIFWRGLWRSAFVGDEENIRKALALTQTLRLDYLAEAPLAAAVLRGMRRTCGSEAAVEAALSAAAQAIERFAADTELRAIATRFAVDAIPTRALAWLDWPARPSIRSIDADSVSAALAMPSLFENETAIDAWRERYREGLRMLDEFVGTGTAAQKASPSLVQSTAFSLAYQGRSDVELQTLRGDVLSRLVRARAPSRATRDANDHRIHVGFVSKHLRDCTVGHYFRRFITDLADERIATYTYACGNFDAFTDAIEARVTHTQRFALKDSENHDDAVLERVAKAIANDALDVLIYPEIGMEPFIEKLAAMRLAPLQCALWGHPDTTGLPTIDVFFSANSMEPEGAQRHYRERLQLLPGLGCAYPKPPVPQPLARAQLDLPEHAPLLVCAQSSFKWRPAFVDTIAQILIENERAKLVYFRDRDRIASLAFDAYLRDRFAKRGVEFQSRIVALNETTRERFIAKLAACDVALDTFDFSGGNTTLDSLSAGLPVVTLPGEFMRGRQSMAMLRIVEAEELVARSSEDYVRIVCNLIDDAEFRGRLRTQFGERSARLFDDQSPIHALKNWILCRK